MSRMPMRRGWDDDLYPESRRSGFMEPRSGGYPEFRRMGFSESRFGGGGGGLSESRFGGGFSESRFGSGFSSRRSGFPEDRRSGFPESRRGGGDGGGPRAEELATKSLFIQNKKFYIDLRRNHRGKFIKLSEVAPTGQKMRVIMDISVAKDFIEKLDEFCEFYSSLGAAKWDESRSNEGKLKSESIFRDDRRYYIDLKENHRGRFLKIAMALSTHERTQIVIPAQGICDIRDVLTEMIAENGGGSSASRPAATTTAKPENIVELDGQQVTINIEENRRGKFIHIAEVNPDSRSGGISIPLDSWGKLMEAVEAALIAKSDELNASPSASRTHMSE